MSGKFLSLFKSSPLNDFLIPFRKAQNQWVARYIIIVFALIVRCAVGIGPYSGEKSPPMFGDFEAQRHWMEITTHLPISRWYYYDLQYWGLDYPPLTAFHSWLLGKFGSIIDSSWFALDTSRGMETSDLKSYLRITSLVSELAFYIPAVQMFTRWMGRYYSKAATIDQTIIAAAILYQPALIIIDHGHFQYNSVMLGLTLLAVVHLLYDNYCLAAIFFVLSISFKQMALYYAPIFFFYLLSICIWSPSSRSFDLQRLIAIGCTVILTLGIQIAPFVLFGGLDQLRQILLRMFPFDRGLFEDKVANFWCATNVVIKYKQVFTTDQLKKLSLVLTLLGISPSCAAIFFRTRKELLAWCLASCSMAFYLFSFQVHEKSILLPWMPITLLLNEVDPDVISMVCWFSNIALFSMWPLLKRDELIIQYFVLGVLSNWLMGNLSWIRLALRVIKLPVSYRELATPVLPHSIIWRLVIVGSYVAAFSIHLAEAFTAPPQSLPHIWVIGNVVVSFGSFVLFWLWCNYKIYIISTTNSKLKTN
ncbi:DEKNAAC101745 [Brettanomyces naardenensis]|uniref:Alpha-1,3-glucosyltransferase n=1 Tax=Brettanomyces naardenensis TaxID=13370 RepID=A0A448YIR6_BRENA|nr:DEKNAAC101745 [Brettanomyces naardenensis]